MNDNYMNALRKRMAEVCVDSSFENKIENMFGDFYGSNERLRKTCRIVWDSFLKEKDKNPEKQTLTFFADPNEMEETFATFLSFLLASKKESVEPLSPEEIEQKWKNGGDFILCSKVRKNGVLGYRKSHYRICSRDIERYNADGECWCTQIVNGGKNRSIKVDPQNCLIFPSLLSGKTKKLA